MEQLYEDMLTAGYKKSTIKQYKRELTKAKVNLTTEHIDFGQDLHGTLYRAFKVFQDWINPESNMRGGRSSNRKKTNLKSWCLSNINPTLIFNVCHLVYDKNYSVDTSILYSNLQLNGKHDNHKNYFRAVKALADFEYPCIDDDDIVQHLHSLILNSR